MEADPPPEIDSLEPLLELSNLIYFYRNTPKLAPRPAESLSTSQVCPRSNRKAQYLLRRQRK
jgi:hypothetical protein